MGCNQLPDLVVVRRPAPDRLAEDFPAVDPVFRAGAFLAADFLAADFLTALAAALV
jgi:hypothetical protein